MKNFIEIGRTEEEQVEQVKTWIKNNWLAIVSGVGLGLGGIWGLGAYDNYQIDQATQARILYLNVANDASNSAALSALETNHANSGYVNQARLILAKSAVKTGDYEAALAQLEPLLTAENSLIRGIARLRTASIYLQMSNFDQAIATLDGATEGKFDGLTSQLKADIYLADNQIENAKKYYDLALTQVSDDSGLKNLLKIKRNDLP